MSKTLKTALLLFIILLSICTFSLATDINMNIPSNDIATTENVTTNTDLNASANTNTNKIKNNSFSNQITDTSDDYTTISSVTETSTDTGLNLSNILNILLIVVGFVLILLAVAILIRLHS